MVSSCSAVGCQNRQDATRPDLLFKIIPSNKKLNSIWKDNIKRAGVLPKDKHIELCWEHFTSDCFERDIKSELLANSTVNVYKIKKDAIPTIFTFTHQPPKRPASPRRGSVRERQYVLDKTITQHEHNVLDETIAQHEETCMEFESKFSEVGCNTGLSFRPD